MPTNGQAVKIAHYTRSKFNSLTSKDNATIYYVEEPDGKIKQYIGNTLVVSDITKAEIEAKLTGSITSHTHNYRPAGNVPWTEVSGKPNTLSGYGITDALSSSLKGTVNGLAELGTDGKVPSSQLPSYVDDVLEYATFENVPITGESGKIYITQDTNKTYRWSGTWYVEISQSLALGTTSSTAYRGDRGKTAYDHSQVAHAPSNAQKNSDITKAEIEEKLNGLITSHTHNYRPAGNVPWTEVSGKPTFAPSNAQKNSDITKAEIEAKLTGNITSHTHSQYLTTFTESDPTVPSHVKSITSGNISSWNNKFNTPAGTTSQYIRGNGSLATFPSIPSKVSQLSNDNEYTTKTYVDAGDSGLSSTIDALAGYVDNNLLTKVDKVTGKGLSSNDYTTTEKNKLSGIATGAQVNVGTNLSQGARSTTTLRIDSSTGNNLTLPAVTTALAGLMTSTDKTRLNVLHSLLEENTANNVVDSINEVLAIFNNYPEGADLVTALAGKVDKVSGKGLSTNDYTTAEKNKLSGIATGAQVNVATNLGITKSGTQNVITSSTGDNTTITGVTTTQAGLVTNGAQTIAGVKTFNSIPVLPTTTPSNVNHAVRKGYVDDKVSGTMKQVSWNASTGTMIVEVL